MQVRIPPELVDAFLEKAGCEVLEKSRSQIVAVKPVGYGRIYIRLKRKTLPYMSEERQFWLGDIHFEKGLRPQRFFESNAVQDFVKKYVKPLAGNL